MTTAPHAQPLRAEDEVARICQELIRIDSSNYGDGSGPGERAAAEHVAALLSDVGLEPELFESTPGRANVVVRLEGTDPSRPALVLHGHTDVVPARAEDWTVPPFAGEEVDGVLWGRGAVDMKDMDAMVLAVVRQMAREGRRPARDVVVAMFADEEAGGVHGASWAVDHRPDLFEGATEAISEVGGYS
ncbi:MAG: M20/M25/M40 family metallo-hydrolase, partial [Cellulomonas sp.]|nr:M20/M25/M40 family metallo-hydrolase [Cellulomonas sp.]